MRLIYLLSIISVAGFASCLEEFGKIPREEPNRTDIVEIIHGKKASIKKFPYIASIVSDGWYGAGVILNKYWILTTAFNVAWMDPSQIQFRVGSNKYNKGGQLLEVEKVHYHENYNGTWDWDIAVVKVNTPIKFGRKVKPIKLATDELKNGTKASVAGWGESTDQSSTPSGSLLTATVTILDNKTCSNTYGDQLTPRLLCTFDEKVGPCVYDYGDPLVVDGAVHGLYAGGVSCTPGVNPVLYTDVASLHQWVKQAIKKVDAEEVI